MRFQQLLISSLVFVGFSGFAQAADDGPLKSKLQAYKVTMNDDGDEILTATEEAIPGDLLEYRIQYENKGANALNSVIVGIPVPQALQFVEDSETASVESAFEASINGGGDWSREPLREYVDGKLVEVSPERYTNIRWIPAREVKAGEQMTFKYRAEVE